MKQNNFYNHIDYDAVIKLFLNSVIAKLANYRSVCPISEQNKVDETLGQLNLMAQNPQNFFDNNKKPYNNESLMGLSLITNKNGHHDIMIYVMVTRVLGRISEYYKIPTSKCFKDALNEVLKEYFRMAAPTVMQRLQYTIMSPEKLLLNLQNQKTK